MSALAIHPLSDTYLTLPHLWRGPLPLSPEGWRGYERCGRR